MPEHTELSTRYDYIEWLEKLKKILTRVSDYRRVQLPQCLDDAYLFQCEEFEIEKSSASGSQSEEESEEEGKPPAAASVPMT